MELAKVTYQHIQSNGLTLLVVLTVSSEDFTFHEEPPSFKIHYV